MANKGGRPSKYDPKMLQVIEDMMKEGASKTEVCAKIGISHETMNQWCDSTDENPYFNKEFSETVKKGQRLSEAWWEKNGRVNLENQKFNYTGWYMNMKNRFGWKDKQEVDARVDGKINIVCNIPLKFDESIKSGEDATN